MAGWETGVYIFVDSDGNCLYIGKSRDVKRRLSSKDHKHHSFKWDKLYVAYFPNTTEGNFIAESLEAKMIYEYQPLHNIRGKI